MDTSYKNILRKGRKIEDVWCCRQATTCIAFLEQYFGCVKKKNRSRSPIFSEGRGASAQASVRNMIGTIRGRPGLRSWRYCLGARLKFWRQSPDPKKGVGTKSFYFSRLTLNTQHFFFLRFGLCFLWSWRLLQLRNEETRSFKWFNKFRLSALTSHTRH